MIYSPESLEMLKRRVRSSLTDKRFSHTIGVEMAAIHIGGFIMPTRIDELRAAALLHDIAKELSRAEQVRLARVYNASFSEDGVSDAVLHSFAAPGAVMEQFSSFASPDVLDAICHHTLGKEDMSLFSEIIFVSDFVEEGREYEACRAALLYLLDALDQASSAEEYEAALHRAAIMTIDSTLSSLKRRGKEPMAETLLTKKALEAKI
ncbi:MAG: bis(5'-nucleosyl)-tetraphosphatase (symmetrical) YqeK [Clostridia bacterium]|nr:bis(5'-nucleosyl)-tetraphosphatase (symmetrical) YqeK [Clostridia bacterium]